jgi:hypothetical protein
MDECQNRYPQSKSEGVLLVQAKNGDKESQEGILRCFFYKKNLNFGVPCMFPMMPPCVPQVLKHSPRIAVLKIPPHFIPQALPKILRVGIDQRGYWLQELLL